MGDPWPVPSNPSWSAAGVVRTPGGNKSYPSSDPNVSILPGHGPLPSQERGDRGAPGMAAEQQAQCWVVRGCGLSEALFTRSSI